MSARKRTAKQFINLAVVTTVGMLLMFVFWEMAEYRFGEPIRSLHFDQYARGISFGLVSAIGVGLVSLRHVRRRTRSLSAEIDTFRRRAENAENILDKVIEAVPAAIILIDEESSVLRANELAERIHGVELSVGQQCPQVLGSEHRCRTCPGCGTKDFVESPIGLRELTDPRTGEIFVIETYGVEAEGGKATLIIERVLTEQRKLQASLLHQEKMAGFGLVAAGVAHEMGNPLSSIEMHLELLAQDTRGEEDAEMVQTLRQETARLRRTLRELVDFARRRRDEATSVSTGAVIRDALRLIRYDRRVRNIEIVLEASIDTPAVYMVEDHLMQVLVNLLLNALDAMPDGGRLHIDTRNVDGHVSLRIRDTGSGMSREVLERCFEPLFTTKEPGKGTGLGLSICKDVLQAAGGNIELHSTAGHGTMVVILLPQEPGDERLSASHEVQPNLLPSPDLTPEVLKATA